MSSLEQVSLSVAALAAILAVGISSTPAQALNIASGSVSGTWDYDYDGAGGLNVGDTFTANYTYDSDSISESNYSYLGYYNEKWRSTSLLSLVLNSGSYSHTFAPGNLGYYGYISWYGFQSTSPSYGLTDYERTSLYAYDNLSPGSNYFYTYNTSGVDYYGNPFDSSHARAYGGYDSDTGTYSINTYSYSPVRFSGATPAPTAVPTPALLPGLIGLGMAALRKRKNQGQETAETAQV
jgi:hypothetical protein